MRNKPHHRSANRCLAATAFTHQPERFPGLDLKTNAIDGLNVANRPTQHPRLDRKMRLKASNLYQNFLSVTHFLFLLVMG
jgi:hypothetical protein